MLTDAAVALLFILLLLTIVCCRNKVWTLKKEKKKPIWMRKPEEINEEDYASLYKSLTTDSDNYLAVKHLSLEGLLEFKAILFVPRKKMNNHIKLYFRQELIIDNCEELMLIPKYLGFVTGVMDYDGLPLNNIILKVIRQNLVEKCIEMFNEMSENKEGYNRFYQAFSNNLKLGINEDSENRDKLADLLRYYSTTSGDELTSLKDYVARMKETQRDIYYITGKRRKELEDSPFLPRMKRKGYEVLLMLDEIDEDAVGQLKTYDGKKLLSARLRLREDVEAMEKSFADSRKAWEAEGRARAEERRRRRAELLRRREAEAHQVVRKSFVSKVRKRVTSCFSS